MKGDIIKIQHNDIYISRSNPINWSALALEEYRMILYFKGPAWYEKTRSTPQARMLCLAREARQSSKD